MDNCWGIFQKYVFAYLQRHQNQQIKAVYLLGLVSTSILVLADKRSVTRIFRHEEQEVGVELARNGAIHPCQDPDYLDITRKQTIPALNKYKIK